MLTLDTVKNKVQKMLIELNGSIKIDKDGDFVVSGNSAHVFVSVYELGAGEEQRFQVKFTCPLVSNVPVTHELFPELHLLFRPPGGSDPPSQA